MPSELALLAVARRLDLQRPGAWMLGASAVLRSVPSEPALPAVARRLDSRRHGAWLLGASAVLLARAR